jgi:hypothetical protein
MKSLNKHLAPARIVEIMLFQPEYSTYAPMIANPSL